MKIARYIAQYLALIAVLAALFAAAPARAEPKPTIWDWWPWHYENLDWSRRYLEDGKIPEHSQWEMDDWKPDDWTRAAGSQKAVMDGLYSSGIVTKQSVDKGLVPIFYQGKGIPVLEVGHNFIRLSDKEKRRVVAYVDSVWGITSKPDGMFRIDYENGDPVGLYTKNGLQLQ